ncbi:hypothetical protein TCAL_03878 [Tigriopus californicus]|uniref:Uncharacterized protein n=1 Tax=Tigriopus californicus TaxID=6832 RepID=A0A553NDQ2_TIGCA|nr:ankyrin repeat domain-containing protein 31-like [Tigriopus californicus]TRY63582.1 hypothetical protein TCAL_03878 [Tigriopus californicus]|eukprot:TCALIF_03878-PA protein Name:"Similar to Tnks2 Tankyrase-2 (Mus musculus)" AED:0.59 eAED:0.59 QI:46/0.66/0.5/0.75/1/1/4/0/245
MGWEQALTDAVYNNNIEKVKHYLRKEEIRRGLGRLEWTWGEAPLHRAAAIGRNDILKVLVEAGCNLDAYSVHDKDRMTCLHLAVWCNQGETVRLLLQLGADPTLKGTWMEYQGTPLDFAREYKNTEILAVFRDFDNDGKITQSSTINRVKGPGASGTRMQTSTILSGLENLPSKEKAIYKAAELLKKSQRAEKNIGELKRRLVQAEKELFDIHENPDFMTQEEIDDLAVEIDELKIFATEVRKVL